MKAPTAYFRDEAGTTAIEYGLFLALISVAIIATITMLGAQLNATFSDVAIFLSSK